MRLCSFSGFFIFALDIFVFVSEMELFEMVADADSATRSDKKSYFNRKGLKRTVALLVILMILGIMHSIIQRLSDTNINVLFNKLFNEMKNISKMEPK